MKKWQEILFRLAIILGLYFLLLKPYIDPMPNETKILVNFVYIALIIGALFGFDILIDAGKKVLRLTKPR